MYLKGIEVQGFKSFADKINLEFGQGITTIVGPNGSGKSNISDAIRWVMGEQSAKSLRGGKMEDVIFAGTQKRSPLGFAQVSIILDNKDNIFKIDYDTVKVTRRVHRSGESNYLINDKECRLKDIHELFMDTGLGKEGYSVIGQGKIDQILSNKAEERRNIFEEASGITKYKYRKAESEKKLLQTDENLVRIKDLLSELESQVGPLENQSKKARKYLDLREVLKGLDINISIRNIDKQKQALKEGQQKFTVAFNQLNSEKIKLAEIESLIETETASMTTLNEKITELRQQNFDLEKSSGSLSHRIDILKTNIENNLRNIERIDEEIKQLGEKITEGDVETKRLEDLIEKKLEEKKFLEEKVANHDGAMQKLDEEISAKLAESEALKDKIVAYLNDNSALKAKISSLDVLIKNFDERKSSLIKDLEIKNEALNNAKSESETLAKDKEENEKLRQKAVDGLEKLKNEYFALTDEMNKAKENQNALVAKCNDLQSRKNVLEDLEKGYEGYSKSVKNILTSGVKNVHGVVSKLVEVDNKYVTAVEIALGGALQNIVVQDEDAAKKCISYLKENRLGRATFLPLTSVKGSLLDKPPVKEKGYVGIASELVTYDAKYDGIFKSLIGRCVVMDNIDNAVALAKKTGYKYKIVTLDGQLLNPGGSLTGGSVNKTQSLLSRSKDIEELGAEIEKLHTVIDENDDKINDFRQQIKKMAEQKEKLDSEVTSCDHQRVKISSATENNNRIIRELERNISLITNESGSVLGEIDDVEKQKDACRAKIAENEEASREVKKVLETVQSEGATLTQRREDYTNSATDDKISFANIEKDIAVSKERIETLNSEKQASALGGIEKSSEKTRLVEENATLEAEIEQIKNEINLAGKSSQELSKIINDNSEAYEKASQKLIEGQKSLKEQNETIYVLQLEVSRIENQNSKLELETEHVTAKLWDEYELTYNAALEYKKEEFNMAESQKEAASLRAQIKALGNINIDSIEQYKEVKERFDYLSAQKLDLDETKSKLEDIIRDMQNIMTEQFKECFEVIRTHFDVVFKALFGGGTGKLSLTDPDNILESGIDIEVQPPGKKLQNMMALSGGERALSAIALLFSVLEVRPTPFCILDEVEAALDDNNVYRFADYIKKYSSKTQFIVVTHRRGTMESADIMYGVTMQEKGVSKLLKLKFEDLEEYN
ncbi:MAG: chromosome segregation protein SMC [Clostridia bacterium]|nr:chromosome segregation protein SMC [Clostridia bacterium]